MCLIEDATDITKMEPVMVNLMILVYIYPHIRTTKFDIIQMVQDPNF